MKKKVLLSAAVLTAGAVAVSAPISAMAAEAGTIQKYTGKCYQVYIGQGVGSLSQILEQIGCTIENNGTICPDAEAPDAETPDVEIPETSEPVNPAPETPDLPVEETPDVQEPETQEPENGEENEAALSYAEQVVKLVNAERAKAGLSALEMKTDITAAANVRAKEIRQVFSHTRPDGRSFSSALKEQGVSFRGSGENIAWGQKTPEQVMNGWMNSDGHRANILNPNYKNIGVGFYQENGVNYWVQLFTY